MEANQVRKFRDHSNLVFAVGVLLPVAMALVAILGPWIGMYVNERLDSVFDELGAFVLLNLGMLLFLFSREKKERFPLLVIGLVAVGIIRILASTMENIPSTFWLKRLESLGIALSFAFGWEKTSVFRRPFIRYSLFISGLLGLVAAAILAYEFPTRLPLLVSANGFSTLSRTLSFVSGFVCLGAVAVWLIRKPSRRGPDELVLLNLCLVYGILNLALPLTQPWQLQWWILHLMLLPPYALALSHIFIVFKRLQDEVASKTFELKTSNESLERFAYVASHDLQEPLRMVTSYLNLLSKRYQGRLDKDADDFIHFASDGAARMKTLITDLLEYSRFCRGEVKLEPVSASAALRRVMDSLKVLIRDNEATVIFDEDLPVVLGNRSQLEQLFQNLISNSIKFRREQSPRIELHARKMERQSQWLFSMKDNGIGFEAKDAERIFAMFQRLHGKHEYPGTGIGLATCKKIVEQGGGKIWAESEPAIGTTFFFTLPVAKDGANPQTDKSYFKAGSL